jgi:succinate dehydrogenase/fumarate reductase flavoprotein subunit
MTRKNMGGVSIDMQARALNRQGQVVPGLYAAGEITGSVGINGSHGMDGMFLGPALLTGRLAGKAVAEAVGTRPRPTANALQQGNDAPAGAFNPAMTAEALTPLLARARDGYWHFEKVHTTVVERRYACTMCHTAQLPFAPVVTRQQRDAQTQLCTNCH